MRWLIGVRVIQGHAEESERVRERKRETGSIIVIVSSSSCTSQSILVIR